jgi:hypothetical protein
MGGIGTLPMDYGQPLQVPQQQQPSFSSAQNITMNPLLNYGQPQLGTAGGTPLTMAGGGSANLVEREKYGLGSVLKKFAKTFIPKELDPVLQFAAPFLGPVYGPIASVAGSARTGKINPLSLAASTLPYLQFGGAGATGLQSLIPTGYGGSGALGQFLPGGTQMFGQQGTSLSNVLSDYMKVGAPSSTGNVSFEMGPDGLKLPGTTITDALSTKPMGTGDLFKTIFSPETNVDLGTRAKAAMDLTGSAIKAMYTDANGDVDKRAVIATISAVPSYLDAKKKAQEAGLSPNEFNEQVYNEEKQFFANRYASNAPTSSFMRTTAAGGGMMNDAEGILSIKLTPAQGMAMGGRMNYGGGTDPKSEDPIEKYIKTSDDYLLDSESEEERKRKIKEEIIFLKSILGKKDGGRIDYAMGGEIPVRQNQGGISELDLRAKGGYIPVGIKEKADDVPAMLSKNEFVFTADAVRGAGGGDINKGAQKMYKLMKSLEKKIKKTKVA